MTRAAFSELSLLFSGINKLLIYLISPMLLVSWFSCDSLASDRQLNKDLQFEYASHLYKSGEYYRAITEYKRLIFFFPESNLVETATLQIGRSYHAGRRIESAIKFWEQELTSKKHTENNLEQLKILLGLSLLDLDQTAIFSFRKTNILKAVDLFNQLDSTEEDSKLIRRFTREWENHNPDKKSPWLAGTLSVVFPGAGSYYTGRYMEGTYAFFLTALFYLATRDAISNDQNELGAIFGLVTIGFYGGGIYTAVNGAHKLNDKRESDELLRLRQKYGIWFIPATEKYPGRF